MTGRAGRLVHRIFVAGLLALAPVASAFGSERLCARPELEWSVWLRDVEQRNPGLRHRDLAGPERDEVLRAYSCLEAGGTCPPDTVWVLHCAGNGKVLLAFVKDGCVTMAEDMAVEDYMTLIKGGDPC